MGLTSRAASAALAAAAVVAGVLGLPGSAVAAAAAPAAAPTPPRPAVLASGEARTLTLRAAPAVVAAGEASTLTGRLADGADGTGLPGEPVRLESLSVHGAWLEVALLTTGDDGWVSAPQVPGSATDYRFRHGDPGAPGEAVSPSVSVSVRALSARWERAAVRLGSVATVRGALDARPGSLLRLDRRVAGRWRPADRTRTAADGSYSFTVRPAAVGYTRWRVVRAARAGVPFVSAALPRLEAFRLHRYSVTTRGTVRADLGEFRRSVAATLTDPRGWAASHRRFREVPRGGDFTVVLSQAGHLPAFSSVCSTTYSCRVGRYVVINQDRWRTGSPYFPGTLAEYRRMVVNHETGHWLGRGHAYCSGRGRLAPVMQQQSKGMQGCRVNPWPLRREVRAVSS